MASIQKRPNGKWRARVVLADGKTQRARHFDRKVDAERWLSTQVVKLRDGTWVDPMEGRRTFGVYAEQWFEAQVHLRDSSRDRMRSVFERHLFPQFGDMPLTAIARSDVQGWVKAQSNTLKPRTVEGHYRLLATVLLAAVDDRVLGSSPCRKINLPKIEAATIVVPDITDVAAVQAALPHHARLIPAVAAGAGLRLGEVLGLCVDRVDWLRYTLRVDQQWTAKRVLGPPKTKASIRTVPVSRELIEALGTHVDRSETLIFREAEAGWRRAEWHRTWAAACERAGVDVKFHDLRHLYASTLIDAGQSVVVVQERLGHASAKETLDTYSHLFERDEDRTREATTSLVRSLVS